MQKSTTHKINKINLHYLLYLISRSLNSSYSLEALGKSHIHYRFQHIYFELIPHIREDNPILLIICSRGYNQAHRRDRLLDISNCPVARLQKKSQFINFTTSNTAKLNDKLTKSFGKRQIKRKSI